MLTPPLRDLLAPPRQSRHHSTFPSRPGHWPIMHVQVLPHHLVLSVVASASLRQSSSLPPDSISVVAIYSSPGPHFLCLIPAFHTFLSRPLPSWPHLGSRLLAVSGVVARVGHLASSDSRRHLHYFLLLLQDCCSEKEMR